MKNNVLNKIKNSGLIEFLYIAYSIFIRKLFSFIKIFFLRLRGYDIDYSVNLGRNVVFFQSVKNSIKIDKNSHIADGARLKAGFDGKIIIGKNVYIHDYSFIYAHDNLKIGDNTMISPNVFITDFDHKYPHSRFKNNLDSKNSYIDKETKIGSNVWIGANSIILKGVIVGDNSIIGAGSVVTKSIPRNSVAVGTPAKVVKKIKS